MERVWKEMGGLSTLSTLPNGPLGKLQIDCDFQSFSIFPIMYINSYHLSFFHTWATAAREPAMTRLVFLKMAQIGKRNAKGKYIGENSRKERTRR
jgi:hypothetical protein